MTSFPGGGKEATSNIPHVTEQELNEEGIKLRVLQGRPYRIYTSSGSGKRATSTTLGTKPSHPEQSQRSMHASEKYAELDSNLMNAELQTRLNFFPRSPRSDAIYEPRKDSNTPTVLEKARKNSISPPPYTHFLAMPLGVTPRERARVEDFLMDLRHDLEAVSRFAALEKAKTLHLTLLLMRLQTNTHQKIARDVLEESSTTFRELQRRIGQLDLKKLDFFGESAESAHVLFLRLGSKEAEEEVIQFARKTKSSFLDHGLSENQIFLQTSLHVTLMKAKRSPRDVSVVYNPNDRVSFDASNLMQKYKTIRLDALSVSQLMIREIHAKGENKTFHEEVLASLEL